MEKGIGSIKFGNNSNQDLRSVMHYFEDAYATGKLHEDIADLFQITILKNYNQDGTDRMIIDMA